MRSVIELVPGQRTDQIGRDAVAGHGPAVVDTPEGPVGVAISWEIFFGGRVRDGVGHGGQVVLNPTNGSSYTGTDAADPADRLVAPAGPGERALGGAGGADRLQRLRHPGRHGARPLRHQRGGGADRTVARREGDTWYLRLGDKPVVAVALAVLAVAMLAGPAGARAAQTSSQMVTGPSLTSSTAISVRNRPVATSAPRARSSATTASTSGSACSGRAAASQLGRRPRLVSP